MVVTSVTKPSRPSRLVHMSFLEFANAIFSSIPYTPFQRSSAKICVPFLPHLHRLFLFSPRPNYVILRTMASAPKNAPASASGKRKSPVPGIVCLLITAGILVAGLWPFNFNPSNKVEWLRDGKGIRFYGQGMVVSKEPLVTRQTTSRSGSITMELLIRSLKEHNNMVATILTLYMPHQEQFIFGQWKKELIIRIPAAKAAGQRRYREIGLANVLKKDTTHLITVSSRKETTDIYVDGQLGKSFPNFSLVPAAGGLSGYLILGNSPEGINSWNGAFLGLAVYDRSLSGKEALDHFHAWQKHERPVLSEEKKPLALYLFDEQGEQIQDRSGNQNNLLIAATFHPLRRTVLGAPEKDQWFSRWNLTDVATNILGFAPFGFFLSAWLRLVKNLPAPRVCGISILLGFCLSLAIELVQVYLPARDSSLMDVFSNILGTALGVFIFKYALPVFHKVKGDSQLIL